MRAFRLPAAAACRRAPTRATRAAALACAVACAGACNVSVALAQPAAAPPAGTPVAAPLPTPVQPPAAAPAAAGSRSAAEPLAALNVAEDDQVRIEELRVRGESQRITVKPKAPGAREYEISPSTGALDPSQRGRRPPGTSLWRVLSF